MTLLHTSRRYRHLGLLACSGLIVQIGCTAVPNDMLDGVTTTTNGNGGDTTGDGDGDGDGDIDPEPTGEPDPTGDGDPDPDPTGDGDPDPTGDGDGDPTGDQPNGSACTSDDECMSLNCYVVPFLGGQCGECNADDDCPDGGCTPPNPFANDGSLCNMGEAGGGCESTSVCQDGLSCATVLDLLGLIDISTCGECTTDVECTNMDICAPVVVVEEFTGQNTCISPNSLPQDSFCDLEGDGDQACESGLCTTIDIMGLAEIGACGECDVDADCAGGTCQAGEFILDTGTLLGSTCI